MQGKRILIVGCGKIGLRVAEQLSQNHDVWGLKRSPKEDTQNLRFLSADVTQVQSLQPALAHELHKGVDYLLYCLTPSERSQKGYEDVYLAGLQNILDNLSNKQRLKRLFFISSTSVYHQDDNQYIDEQSPTLPRHFSGKTLLLAEDMLRASNLPSTVIRFSGIYGGNRTRLIDQVKHHNARNDESLRSVDIRTTNRIHEDDCVGFINHLIEKSIRGSEVESLYIASDSLPSDLNEVLEWLAEQLDKTLSAPAKIKSSRRSGNKKCRNARMLDSGYLFKHPTFKDGYLDMLKTPAE